MHRLWGIADIVYLICNEVSSRGDLYALACTSRSVGHEALSFLWEDLSDPRHLTAILTMSSDRLTFYGQLVRSLTLNGRDPQRIIERLVHGPKDTLFPNLHTVKLRLTAAFGLLAALRLLPAWLPHIEITFPSTPVPSTPATSKLHWNLWSGPVKDLLSRCRSTDGSQATLSVDGLREFADTSMPMVLEALGSLRASLGEFRGLNVPTDPSLLTTLAGLSQLRSLHLHSRRSETLALPRKLPDDTHISVGFKALRSLHLSCAFGTVTRVMRHIEGCLEDISISTNIASVPTDVLHDFARVILSQHAPTLKRLDLRFDDDQHRGLLFGWSTFSALQDCHRMESFSLHYASFCPSHFALSDAHLQAIATSWPQLRRLSLIWYPFEEEEDIVPSLGSLVTLCAYIPTLAHLALSTLDMDWAEVPPPPVGLPPPHLPVLRVDLTKILRLWPQPPGRNSPIIRRPELALAEAHVEGIRQVLCMFRRPENVRVRCADLEELRRSTPQGVMSSWATSGSLE